MRCVFLFLSLLYVKQEPGQIPPAEAGTSWGAQAELTSKPACLPARQLKGQRLCPLPVPLNADLLPSFKVNAQGFELTI